MARVTGIGGVFLRSNDPKALAKWYSENLGIKLADFNGTAFQWSDEVPEDTGMTAWSTFPSDTSYFGEGQQAVMINYRVDDIDALLATLSAAGVWIDPKRDDQPYGRFAWIKDCDGNRLELWQPLE
ncbi:MAG: VOC family protein [Acidobacteriaceae bacterium]